MSKAVLPFVLLVQVSGHDVLPLVRFVQVSHRITYYCQTQPNS